MKAVQATNRLLRDDAKVEDHWVATHAVQAVLVAPVPHAISSNAYHVCMDMVLGSRIACSMEQDRPKCEVREA